MSRVKDATRRSTIDVLYMYIHIILKKRKESEIVYYINAYVIMYESNEYKIETKIYEYM